MTLLVALRGTDGLALAADSRGTFGDPRGATAQNDAQEKAHILSDRTAVLAAGASEVGALIVEQVKESISGQGTDGVTPVMNALRDTARANYNEWFPTVPPIQPFAAVQQGAVASRPEVGFLVAGYELDGPARIYQLSAMTDFAPMLHDYGFAVQGIAQYALYLLNTLYEDDRTVEELIPLAIYVITETASQDGKVGGPVKVIAIGAEDGCKALTSEEVDKVRAENENRSRSLRDSFYERGEDNGS